MGINNRNINSTWYFVQNIREKNSDIQILIVITFGRVQTNNTDLKAKQILNLKYAFIVLITPNTIEPAIYMWMPDER